MNAVEVGNTFSVNELVNAIKVFVNYLFGAEGPIMKVLNIIVTNQILWVFLAFAICTIGISLLRRIRRIF